MEKSRNNVITIGNFDGIHLGHREIIKTAERISSGKKKGLILITFTPNPKLFFKRIKKLIFTDKQKSEIFSSMNIERVEYLNFFDIYKLKGNEFIKNFLIEKFSMEYLVVGENFKLGKERECDIKKLKDMENELNFSLIVVPSVKLEGEKISSTIIREHLSNGNIEKANVMLGRRFFIEGDIITGDKLGRKLGFPTINLLEISTILANGVYETETEIEDTVFDSITYIGASPTLKNGEIIVETHIFNFNHDVYGKKAKIYFKKKTRNEIKFTSEKKLIEQIKKDITGIKVDKKPLF
ncbi:MAG: bifunctional riboflavin kinase/FAD synthetase [Acidobacteriota bacterium]